jgi:excisionase family DNA binding protein
METPKMLERTNSNRLLAVADAADQLGLSVLTIYKWVASRRIACVRLGRAVRIPETEIGRLIEVGTRPARRDR